MKKNEWVVSVSFLNLDGIKVVTTIRDRKLSNILSAVDMIPTAKVLHVLGERVAA